MKESKIVVYESKEIRGDRSGNDMLLIRKDGGDRSNVSRPSEGDLGRLVSYGVTGALFMNVNYKSIYPGEGACGDYQEELNRIEQHFILAREARV